MAEGISIGATQKWPVVAGGVGQRRWTAEVRRSRWIGRFLALKRSAGYGCRFGESGTFVQFGERGPHAAPGRPRHRARWPSVLACLHHAEVRCARPARGARPTRQPSEDRPTASSVGHAAPASTRSRFLSANACFSTTNQLIAARGSVTRVATMKNGNTRNVASPMMTSSCWMGKA